MGTGSVHPPLTRGWVGGGGDYKRCWKHGATSEKIQLKTNKKKSSTWMKLMRLGLLSTLSSLSNTLSFISLNGRDRSMFKAPDAAHSQGFFFSSPSRRNFCWMVFEERSSSTSEPVSISLLLFVFLASNSCVDGSKIIFK